MFFYVGLNFVLRGIQEQYDLVPSQFTRVPQDIGIYDASVYYEYREYISKNNQHRFKDINAKNKIVKAFALPGYSRCVVKLLDKYFSLLPSDAPYLYMRGTDKFSPNPSVSSFVNKRVGVNVLKNMIPGLSEKSGIQARYTNHSLWATAITRMFNGEVEEKIIAEKSGHKSLKALRCYEHTSEQKLQNVSRVINETTEAAEECRNSGNKDSCSLSSNLEQHQITKTESIDRREKVADLKKEQITDGLQDDAKPVTPKQAFSGMFSNCTINIP